jgi:hypothetical protein
VAAVIPNIDQYAVTLSEGTVARFLIELGLTPQKPVRRAWLRALLSIRIENKYICERLRIDHNC